MTKSFESSLYVSMWTFTIILEHDIATVSKVSSQLSCLNHKIWNEKEYNIKFKMFILFHASFLFLCQNLHGLSFSGFMNDICNIAISECTTLT